LGIKIITAAPIRGIKIIISNSQESNVFISYSLFEIR